MSMKVQIPVQSVKSQDVRYTKKGNPYKNTNTGKIVGSATYLGSALYAVTCPQSRKTIKDAFNKAAKGLEKSKLREAKIGMGVGIAVGLVEYALLGLGIGVVIDACFNKINAKRADKIAEENKEQAYIMQEFSSADSIDEANETELVELDELDDIDEEDEELLDL